MEQRQNKRPLKNSIPPDSQPTLFAVEKSTSEFSVPTIQPAETTFDTAPIIEVTAQLVDALERGDPQAKVYVEKLLEKYVELYGEAGADNFQRAFEGVTRAKRQRLPERIPQQTSQEVRALAVALSDGHTLTRWEDVLGEVALRHVIADEPFQVKFAPGPALMAGWAWCFQKKHYGKNSLSATLMLFCSFTKRSAQLSPTWKAANHFM